VDFLDRRLLRTTFRPTFRVAVAAVLAVVVVVGYVVVAIVRDVPEGSGSGHSWPGQGFVVLAAIGVIAVASLVDVLRPGRARRSDRDEPRP
jgi:hypothetical protein